MTPATSGEHNMNNQSQASLTLMSVLTAVVQLEMCIIRAIKKRLCGQRWFYFESASCAKRCESFKDAHSLSHKHTHTHTHTQRSVRSRDSPECVWHRQRPSDLFCSVWIRLFVPLCVCLCVCVCV